MKSGEQLSVSLVLGCQGVGKLADRHTAWGRGVKVWTQEDYSSSSHTQTHTEPVQLSQFANWGLIFTQYQRTQIDSASSMTMLFTLYV